MKNILTEKGVKPSIHRIKILQYLMERKNHPTADTIYKDIIKDVPTLSKTTVYNTMQTFQEHGVVQTLSIEENEARFDADTSFHGHFKCTRCGRIYDIPLRHNPFSEIDFNGHQVSEKQLYLKGICKNCMN